MLDASTIQPVQLQNANEIFMLDASTIQLVQLQNANDILSWMLQLTQHIQLQNENDDLKGITWNNYKMIPNTKWGAQPLLFVQKKSGWQSVLSPKSSPFRSCNLKVDQ